MTAVPHLFCRLVVRYERLAESVTALDHPAHGLMTLQLVLG